MARMSPVIVIILAFVIGRRRRIVALWSLVLRRSFQDFIEFPAVKPNAAAFGAVIYFNPLSFRHDKGDIAFRAFHKFRYLDI
jgi:hypothetical protein